MVVGCIRCVRGKGRMEFVQEQFGPLTVVTGVLHLTEGLGEGRRQKRLNKLEASLWRCGVHRVVLPEPFSCAGTLELLRPVDVLPLYREFADVLALKWLECEGLTALQGRVALAAPRMCPELRQTAERLCHKVRELIIRVPGGGEDYARQLHRRYGLPVIPCSARADVTVAFGPGVEGESVLPLYGEGPKVSLAVDGLTLPADCAASLSALLWEMGWLSRDRLHITFSRQRLANSGSVCYNY